MFNDLFYYDVKPGFNQVEWIWWGFAYGMDFHLDKLEVLEFKENLK